MAKGNEYKDAKATVRISGYFGEEVNGEFPKEFSTEVTVTNRFELHNADDENRYYATGDALEFEFEDFDIIKNKSEVPQIILDNACYNNTGLEDEVVKLIIQSELEDTLGELDFEFDRPKKIEHDFEISEFDITSAKLNHQSAQIANALGGKENSPKVLKALKESKSKSEFITKVEENLKYDKDQLTGAFQTYFQNPDAVDLNEFFIEKRGLTPNIQKTKETPAEKKPHPKP